MFFFLPVSLLLLFALTISSLIPRLSRDITPELFYCSTYISSAFIRIGISISAATALPYTHNDYYLIAYKNKSLYAREPIEQTIILVPNDCVVYFVEMTDVDERREKSGKKVNYLNN